MDKDKRAISTTTNGLPPYPGFEEQGAPAPIDPATGQHRAYWVLSVEERAKGFVRPLRFSYVHTGEQPRYPLRDITEEERNRDIASRGNSDPYVKFEAYPESESPVTGRFWTQKQLDNRRRCGGTTIMGQALGETYARDPNYYGSTFCAVCGTHFPVREFLWTGTQERVGS